MRSFLMAAVLFLSACGVDAPSEVKQTSINCDQTPMPAGCIDGPETVYEIVIPDSQNLGMTHIQVENKIGDPWFIQSLGITGDDTGLTWDENREADWYCAQPCENAVNYGRYCKELGGCSPRGSRVDMRLEFKDFILVSAGPATLPYPATAAQPK